MSEEIEIIEDFPVPSSTNKNTQKFEISGGLIGWKCGRCNCQNPINIKICKECNHAKPNENTHKSRVININQSSASNKNSLSENSVTHQNRSKSRWNNMDANDHELLSKDSNRTDYLTVSGKIIQNKNSNVTDNQNVSGKIIKRITSNIPTLAPGPVSDSSYAQETKSRKGTSSQNASLNSGKEEKPNHQNNRDRNRGISNRFQDIPTPLMANEFNQRAIGQFDMPLPSLNNPSQNMHQTISNYENRKQNNRFDSRNASFDSPMPTFNTPSQNMHPPLINHETRQQTNGFNDRNSLAHSNFEQMNRSSLAGRFNDRNLSAHNSFEQMNRNSLANRSINSYVQDFSPVMHGIEAGYQMNRWGGPMKDQKPCNREFREEQMNWNRGFQAEQANPKDKVSLRLEEVFHNKSTNDIPNIDMSEKKFNMRARLFLGNLGEGTTEKSLKEMVSQYGEIGETFFQTEKRFAFFRMATRSDAESAKRALDGHLHNGRNMKVRLSPHQGAIKVSNLSPWVSNELLYLSFSIFGDIERAFVSCDERGQSKEEGIVEFVNKHSAVEAVKRCNENCYFLTTTLRPVFVELNDGLEPDEDGLQDHMLLKRNQEFGFERSSIPRFAKPESFEFEYGNKWKQLYDMKKAKLQALEREMKLEESKLIAQMEFSRYEHETESLRSALKQKEEFCEQQKHMWTLKSKQMDDLIQQEKEKRKALNSSLAKNSSVSIKSQNTNIPQQTSTKPNQIMKDVKPTNLLMPNLSKPNLTKPNVEFSQMQENISHFEAFSSTQVKKTGVKDQNNKDLSKASPRNTNKSLNYLGFSQGIDHGAIKVVDSKKSASNTSFEGLLERPIIGKFEQEMNQMFPHLANFSTTFANMDGKVGENSCRKSLFDQGITKNPLHSDPDFGNMNPLMQPPTTV